MSCVRIQGRTPKLQTANIINYTFRSLKFGGLPLSKKKKPLNHLNTYKVKFIKYLHIKLY